MELLSVIRRWAFRDQLSIREISRRTGLSRNTIRKYLRADVVEPVFKAVDLENTSDNPILALDAVGLSTPTVVTKNEAARRELAAKRIASAVPQTQVATPICDRPGQRRATTDAAVRACAP